MDQLCPAIQVETKIKLLFLLFSYITGQVPVGDRAAARGSLSSDPSVFSVHFSKIEQVQT